MVRKIFHTNHFLIEICCLRFCNAVLLIKTFRRIFIGGQNDMTNINPYSNFGPCTLKTLYMTCTTIHNSKLCKDMFVVIGNRGFVSLRVLSENIPYDMTQFLRKVGSDRFIILYFIIVKLRYLKINFV